MARQTTVYPRWRDSRLAVSAACACNTLLVLWRASGRKSDLLKTKKENKNETRGNTLEEKLFAWATSEKGQDEGGGILSYSCSCVTPPMEPTFVFCFCAFRPAESRFSAGAAATSAKSRIRSRLRSLTRLEWRLLIIGTRVPSAKLSPETKNRRLPRETGGIAAHPCASGGEKLSSLTSA